MAEEGQDKLETFVPPVAGPGAAAALRAETAAATPSADDAKLPTEPETTPDEAKAMTTTRAAAKTSGKSTEYVVFYSEARDGPFTMVRSSSPGGTFVAQGQQNAKREGAKAVGAESDDGIEAAEKYFFMAVPSSSFRPERPSITLQITFATEDAADAAEDDE